MLAGRGGVVRQMGRLGAVSGSVRQRESNVSIVICREDYFQRGIIKRFLRAVRSHMIFIFQLTINQSKLRRLYLGSIFWNIHIKISPQEDMGAILPPDVYRVEQLTGCQR
jgi:hypothetical protein